MGVAGQIGEHGLGSGEGTFGVDDPLALAQGFKPVGEGPGIGECLMLTKELQLRVRAEITTFISSQPCH